MSAGTRLRRRGPGWLTGVWLLTRPDPWDLGRDLAERIAAEDEARRLRNLAAMARVAAAGRPA